MELEVLLCSGLLTIIENNSTEETLKCRIHQGSFLGPLLFLTLGRTREGGWMLPPPSRKVFLSFFLEDKTLAPDEFS